MKAFPVLFFAVSCIAFVSCYRQYSVPNWNNFKAQHEKIYKNSSEDLKRMKIWMENKKEIEAHNKLYAAGKVSYYKAINKFSDMTAAEVKKLFTGLKTKKPTGAYEKRVFIKPNGPVADEVDWRTKGAVTPVKDQGQCGSCYAFSGVGAIEGQHFLSTGQLISFSEQQIVDCSGDFNDNGCNGGLMESVYEYVEQAGGLDTEDDYPYGADEENCAYDESEAEATVQSFETVQESEEALQNAVSQVGPVSVGIYVANSFYQYGGGVYNEPNCDGQIDHGVLAVGYGTENGNDYWLVKNSWGTNWGEAGYIKMARNMGNQCSITSDATYPTGVGSKKAAKKSDVSNRTSANESFFMKLILTKSAGK